MRRLTIPAALLLLSTPLMAQERSGFFFDVGIGAGLVTSPVEGESASEWGASGNLALGGTLSPSVQIGGGTFGWYKKDWGTMGNLMAIINWFPSPTGNFWLRGGAGYYVWSEPFDISQSGFSFAASGGYDLMVSPNIGIAPYATFLVGLASEIKVDGTGTGINASFRVFQLGAMLSIN